MDTHDKLMKKMENSGKNHTTLEQAILFRDRILSLHILRKKVLNSYKRATTPKMKQLLREKIDRLAKELDNIVEK